jgi:hypothetical protein
VRLRLLDIACVLVGAVIGFGLVSAVVAMHLWA